MTMPRAMTQEEIRETVKEWAEGAERYQKGDFDGVEIHASQGYLLTEFLSPYTNRRKDEYGARAITGCACFWRCTVPSARESGKIIR
jgi:2,4-dienoyl-CoA reductase-like NADH-dependent reductase (Old Yellow Enzyme family)